MKYRYLGKTGLEVSEISLGTQTFGWTTDADEAHKMLDQYVAAGGNYLDAADSYNGGKSEAITGEWLRSRKNAESLIIGTKVFFPRGETTNPNDRGLSRKHIVQSLEGSLKRLGVEAIDLYQLHCYDAGVGLDEIAETMNILIRSGKILHYGLSNFTPSVITKLLCRASQGSCPAPSTLQLEYSLLVRSPEWELLPVCTEAQVGTLSWSPLAGGWLTGKYKKAVAAPENSRVGRKDRWDDQEDQRGGEHTWAILQVLEQIATQRGVTPGQVALNWLRRKTAISSILIGARNQEQLKQNLACLEWEMTIDEEAALDQESAIPKPYPYHFIERYTRSPFRGKR